MHNSDLRPIDARVMKPGDPVLRIDGTRKEGTPGRFIGYVPEADEDYRCVLYFEGDRIPTALTIDGRPHRGATTLAFFPPTPDPIDMSPGNVDQLRKSQGGEGGTMNTVQLKPIDARIMKFGDKCVEEDGSECRFLAYDPSGQKPQEHAAIRDSLDNIVGVTFDGRLNMGDAPQFFFPPHTVPLDKQKTEESYQSYARPILQERIGNNVKVYALTSAGPTWVLMGVLCASGADRYEVFAGSTSLQFDLANVISITSAPSGTTSIHVRMYQAKA